MCEKPQVFVSVSSTLLSFLDVVMIKAKALSFLLKLKKSWDTRRRVKQSVQHIRQGSQEFATEKAGKEKSVSQIKETSRRRVW